MRILYEAYKHDPLDPTSGSGADYGFYTALKKVGEVKVLGPDPDRTHVLERVLKRAYTRVSGSKYSKFPWTAVRHVSEKLNQAEREWQPDVVFSIFPAALVHYTGEAPCVYRLDTCITGIQAYQQSFGTLMYKSMQWQEKQAFKRCARIITHSEWSKQLIVDEYGVDAKRIVVFPNPAALPQEAVPDQLDVRQDKRLGGTLRLLTVGRDYERKGIDIAIEVAELLNARGVDAELTVCGLDGKGQPHVRFAGLFDKDKPEELAKYTQLYQQAHFLIHPARFDASPIVTSEAAAFGTPTITNAAGGIATSVAHQESGIVLPENSPPAAYVESIVQLTREPEPYYELCERTRARYERELNWRATGNNLARVVREVVEMTKKGQQISEDR